MLAALYTNLMSLHCFYKRSTVGFEACVPNAITDIFVSAVVDIVKYFFYLPTSKWVE